MTVPPVALSAARTNPALLESSVTTRTHDDHDAP
jgi:hypothetical protein